MIIISYNHYIDHTLLKPNATQKQIESLCIEARKYNFASVCIHPYWVCFAVDQLKETDVNICTVIGFPLGSTTTTTKVFEATEAINHGATEIDMVINIGSLKDGNNELVLEDIRSVVEATRGKALIKVILETCLLSDAEKKVAAKLAVQAGADYVKTSTGFSTGGAMVNDVTLLRQVVGPDVGVKASGGIRSANDMLAMIHAGANRIGTSCGVQLLQELNQQ